MIADRRSQFLRRLEQHSGVIQITSHDPHAKVIRATDNPQIGKKLNEHNAHLIHGSVTPLEMVYALE